MGHGTWDKGQGTRDKIQDTRYKVQGESIVYHIQVQRAKVERSNVIPTLMFRTVMYLVPCALYLIFETWNGSG